LDGDGWNEFIDIQNASISRKLVYFDAASTEYFQTLQMPMIVGWDFSENDTPASPLEAPWRCLPSAFYSFIGAQRPSGRIQLPDPVTSPEF
jgi:hypothetical protein